MARYFFDTDDGERQVRDEIGIDLASIDDIASTTRDLLIDRKRCAEPTLRAGPS